MFRKTVGIAVIAVVAFVLAHNVAIGEENVVVMHQSGADIPNYQVQTCVAVLDSKGPLHHVAVSSAKPKVVGVDVFYQFDVMYHDGIVHDYTAFQFYEDGRFLFEVPIDQVPIDLERPDDAIQQPYGTLTYGQANYIQLVNRPIEVRMIIGNNQYKHIDLFITPKLTQCVRNIL